MSILAYLRLLCAKIFYYYLRQNRRPQGFILNFLNVLGSFQKKNKHLKEKISYRQQDFCSS